MEDYPGIIFGLMERLRVFVYWSLVLPQPIIQIRDSYIPYMRTFSQYYRIFGATDAAWRYEALFVRSIMRCWASVVENGDGKTICQTSQQDEDQVDNGESRLDDRL